MHRIGFVGCAEHLQLVLLGIVNEPGPATSEMRGRHLGESLMQFVHRSEVANDRALQFALGNRVASGAHAVPEERMVPDLSSLVVNASRDVGDVVFQRLSVRSLCHVVEIVHIPIH